MELANVNCYDLYLKKNLLTFFQLIPFFFNPDLKKLDNIIALNVSKDLITWLIVNKYGSIISWDNTKLHDNKSKLVNFELDYQELQTIFTENILKNNQQPHSAFVFESRKYKTLDIRFVPLMMKINRQELMLQCIIKNYLNSLTDKPSDNPFKVFSLNREHVGQKFKIVIGNERTTSAEIVKHILHGNALNHLAIRESRDFKRYFRSINETNVRESIAKNYIQAACFLKKLNYVKFFKARDDIKND